MVELYIYQPSGPSWNVIRWTLPVVFKMYSCSVIEPPYIHPLLRSWFLWDVTQSRLVVIDVLKHPVSPIWRVKSQAWPLNLRRWFCNIPEDPRSNLHRGVSVTSRTPRYLYQFYWTTYCGCSALFIPAVTKFGSVVQKSVCSCLTVSTWIQSGSLVKLLFICLA
jgi:hypothetical protein